MQEFLPSSYAIRSHQQKSVDNKSGYISVPDDASR